MTSPDERQADLLDRAWDRRTAARPPDETVAGTLSPARLLAETVDRFHAADDLPAPDPTFLRGLREDLMRAHPSAHLAPMGQPLPPRERSNRRPTVGSLPVPSPQPEPRRRSLARLAEVAAIAALLAVIAAGTLLGLNGWPRRDGSGPTAAPVAAMAPATPGPAVEAGAAMPLGNAARTGEVAGPGPLAEPDERWQAEIVPGAVGEMWEAPAIVDGVAYFSAVLRDPEREMLGEDALIAFDLGARRPLWQTTESALDFEIVSAPAVSAGLLYVGIGGRASDRADEPPIGGALTETSGALIALDARTGAERWRASVGRPIYPSPVVADGMVYATSADGTVHAFDAASGAERWRTPVATVDPTTGEATVGEPAVGAGIVVVVENFGTVHALDQRTGQERWRADAVAITLSSLVSDGLVVVTSESFARYADEVPASSLVAFDAATGAQRWSIALAEGYPSQPLAGSGLVVVAVDGQTDDGSRLTAYDARTGLERWSVALDQRVSQGIVLAGGALYFTGYDFGPIPDLAGILDLVGLGGSSDLYALDAATGNERWRIGIADDLQTSPAVDRGAVYLFESEVQEAGVGTLHAYGEAP